MEDDPKHTINHYQDQRLDRFEKNLEEINKHIGVINGELGSVKTDLSWVKKFLWVIVTALIGMMLALLKVAFL